MTLKNQSISLLFGEGGIRLFKKILVRKLGSCIIFSFVCASSIFLLLQHISANHIETKYQDSDFVKSQMQREVATLQQYITGNNITIENFYKITQWVDKDKITAISLYYDDRLIYDSTISYCAETLSSGINHKPLPGETLYPIYFKDTKVLMSLTVYLKHHDYDIALLRNLSIFFLVFLSIVLFFIQRKTSYILHLEQQVQLMQGGKFDSTIEKKGNDEIASLAENIDEMRKVFAQQNQAQASSRKFASAMTHDIRTPLSALIGYLDIVINKRSPDEKHLEQYLLKSFEKATQLKDLTDHLFDHFVISEHITVEDSEESIVDCFVLENLIFDGVLLLESKRFKVKVSFAEHTKYCIKIHRESLQRILDNVFSNLLRYADNDEYISIRIELTRSQIIMEFYNKISNKQNLIQGSGIGLKSCKEILYNYGGQIIIDHKNEFYKLTILLSLD